MGQKVEILVTGAETDTVERLYERIDCHENSVFPRHESACIRIAYGETAVQALADRFEARKSMIFQDGGLRAKVPEFEGEAFMFDPQRFEDFLKREGLHGDFMGLAPLAGTAEDYTQSTHYRRFCENL